MIKEKRNCSWLQKNKKKLVVAGVCIVSGIIVIKKWDLITNIISKYDDYVKTTKVQNDAYILKNSEIQLKNGKITYVNEHIRNMQEGYHASLIKICEARDRGIELGANQTIVSTYTKKIYD